ARQLRDLRYSDEQIDVRLRSAAQPSEQRGATEQRKRLAESRFPGGGEQGPRRSRCGHDQGVVEGSRFSCRAAEFPHRRCSGADAASRERADKATLFAQDARTRWIPCRTQDGEPPAMDLDLVRTQAECAREAGSGTARGKGERTLQFLQCRLPCLPGESDAADPVGANLQERS